MQKNCSETFKKLKRSSRRTENLNVFLVYDQIVGSGVSLVAILSDVLFVVSPHMPLGIAKDITSVWYNNQS